MSASWPSRPLPVLAGEYAGFRLRSWREGDAPALAAAWADADIRTWSSPPAADIEIARRWIRGDDERRRRAMALDTVVERDGIVAGEVGLSQFGVRVGTCAVGFWVGAAHRGHGLGAAAVTAVLDCAVADLGLTAALATTDPRNLASVVTLERSGFRHLTGDDDRVVYAWRRS